MMHSAVYVTLYIFTDTAKIQESFSPYIGERVARAAWRLYVICIYPRGYRVLHMIPARVCGVCRWNSLLSGYRCMFLGRNIGPGEAGNAYVDYNKIRTGPG